MLTSNLWTPFSLHNGDSWKVIDFVYMNSYGPQYQTLPEAVVVQFSHLEPDIPDFLENYPGSVSITTITAERKKSSGNGVFTHTKFPLNLSWALTIQKSQGKTLECIVIDLGAGDKFNDQANGLHYCLYLAKGDGVMLNSNLWTYVGLYNITRGEVIDFIYMNSDVPQSQTLPEAVIVQFSHLEPDMPDFLEDYPGSVSIPTITAELIKPSGNGVFKRMKFPLNLSWALTIHKSQWKTLERLVIDLVAGEKCSGLTLVALSRVRMFKQFPLKPLTFE